MKIINREQAIHILKKYSPMLDDEDLTEEMIDDITLIKKRLKYYIWCVFYLFAVLESIKKRQSPQSSFLRLDLQPNPPPQLPAISHINFSFNREGKHEGDSFKINYTKSS
ncbi:hypothetical protein BW899_23870 [Bacillus mycoides]|nr:hypothetical protein BW899_23870 [Bacillus mycoides]